MLEAVSKSLKEGQIARESLIDKAWLINEARDWAKKTMESDQNKWRKDEGILKERQVLRDEFVRLGFDIGQYENLLKSNPTLEDEIALKNRLQVYLDKKEPSVELIDFYFLTDRITIALYGYQFFGTQNNKANLISLPDNIRINFARNPALFCTKLVEREFPKELRTPPNNLEIYHLWLLAAQDSQKFGLQDLEANAKVSKYEQKMVLKPV